MRSYSLPVKELLSHIESLSWLTNPLHAALLDWQELRDADEHTPASLQTLAVARLRSVVNYVNALTADCMILISLLLIKQACLHVQVPEVGRGAAFCFQELVLPQIFPHEAV